ncbi:MAG: cobalamin B12-binding domain-containing protein [Solirubrobacteraceae bacterium]
MADRIQRGPDEPTDDCIKELADAFAEALLAGDEVAAEIAVREAMDAELSSAEIDEKLIAPALWLVGELWERGKISVAEEHLATEISIRVLALQREAQRVARSRSGHRVMLATPTGELHVVALRMIENLLRGAGYDVVMLGPDVPAKALGDVARRMRADVVCMSLTMAGHRSDILRAIDNVRLVLPSAGFVVGGRGLTDEGQRRPLVHVCHRVSEVVEAVDATVKRASLN